MTQRSTTYFIADLHIGAKYITDPRDHERRVVDFLRSIKDDAKTLYLMGDVLDYWFEYKKVVPRGYIRFFGALAELADAGVEIIWFVGNHDIWLFDYLRDEIGLKVVDGVEIREIDGKRFFLSHGDGVGRIRPGFRIIRSLFRNRFCQWLLSMAFLGHTPTLDCRICPQLVGTQPWQRLRRKIPRRKRTAN